MIENLFVQSDLSFISENLKTVEDESGWKISLRYNDNRNLLSRDPADSNCWFLKREDYDLKENILQFVFSFNIFNLKNVRYDWC